MKINAPASADPGTQDQQPETARESIRAAMDEVKEKTAEQREVKPQSEVKEPVVEQKEVKPQSEAKEPVVEVKPPDKVEAKKEEKKEEVKEPKEPVEAKPDDKKEEVKAKKAAPFGVSKKLRASWDAIPEDVQDEVSKIVKENLDTKANQGRKSYLNDVDQLLTPYLPELQRLGATPAQLVDRFLKYANALGNDQYKYQAIARLAGDYNIDLTLFGKQPKDQNQNDNSQQDDNLYDNPAIAELSSKIDTIVNEFSQMRGAQRTDNDKVAEDSVNKWAGYDPTTQEYKAKPYFPYVRQHMGQLIASQTVPLVNGKVDLDAVYEAACYVHPEIREHMLEDQKVALEARKLEEQKQAAAALARTKNAGSSLKPAAPATRLPSQTNSKSNNQSKQLSIADSIRAAIAEAREARI